MAAPFEMPKLGLTMEEGTIVEWLVADGAEVEQGSAVLTIETDKVSSDVEASGTGVLRITGAAGDTFACGERIGWFLEDGEALPEHVAKVGPTPPTSSARPVAPPQSVPIRTAQGRLAASPNARRVAALRNIDLWRVTGSGPGGRIVSEDVLAAPPEDQPAASFAAHQLAARHGLDLRSVRAGGPGTRISRADVERHVSERLATPAPIAATPTQRSEQPLLQAPSSTVALTGMRGTIAARMHAALLDMAQLTLTMDVVMDAVVAHRTATAAPDRAGYTDYVVWAAAQALVEHPIVNSQICDNQVALLPDVNVGVAVAIDGGLVVPVVSQANTLTLGDLSTETTRLAQAARSGTLTRTDIDGGTFSVTALGMYGVDTFTPVINPPNTAILGVGRLREGIRWDDDRPVKTTVLSLSLTWDHRAFDGAPAAQFAAAVRDHLEGWGHVE